jgi:hypothetical protein
MAEINFYLEEAEYVRGKFASRKDSNSFLEKFCEACLRADNQNYELLRPALRELMKKYPLTDWEKKAVEVSYDSPFGPAAGQEEHE